MKFKIGDSVKVKPGIVVDEMDVSGWHGRIDESDYDDDEIVCVRLDSIVLRSLSEDYIKATLAMTTAESFNAFYLRKDDVEPAPPRDTVEDIKTALDDILRKYEWAAEEDGSGEFDLIQQVMLIDEFTDPFDKWNDYIQKNVSFPFRAKVSEFQEYSKVRYGDVLTVKSIEELDYNYGILVKVRKRLESFVFPLCDLEAVDKNSPNYLPIRAYVVWFANR